MSRLVPQEVSELMNAYSSIYGTINESCEGCTCNPCTCEEEVVVEEEDYIEEQGGRRGTGGGAQATAREVGAVNRALSGAASAVGQSLRRADTVPTARPAGARQNLRGGGSRPVTAAVTARPPAAAPASRPPSRFAGARDAAFARAQQIQGSPVVGPRQPAATARPATPSARPAAPAPAARPAATSAPAARPAASPAPTATAKPATTPASTPAAAPSKPSLASGVEDIKRMRMASQMRQKGANVVSTQLAGFDPFDVIKGHLLDEGYADSEDAALKIMANMSEDWKQSILEADSVAAMRERAAKRRKQRYGKDGGGGRDDFRPYTKDDYENPKPGYGSGAASQAKGA